MTRQLNVKSRHREQIKRLLREHLPGVEVWAYGSRVNGRSHEGSDLDLVLRGPGLAEIDTTQLAEFNEAVQESTIPFLVEARDWARLPESFHREIEREYVVLVEGEEGTELFGSLPEGWKQSTLGETCSRGGGGIQTGPFGSQLHASDYAPIGIPSIMPQNIGDNRIDENGIARISQEDANRLKRYLVREGDIVYSRRGDVEKRALVRDNENGWLCGTGCLRVRLGDNGVDPRYTSYFLGHPRVREWIVRHAHGATMPNLNTSILSACPFVTPPKEEQRAIAHILGTLDDKIELNRRMNETLEEMVQTLFKSWFVDFDPVHAKAALKRHAANLAPLDWTVERARAYLDEMDPSIAALFPDHFVDSELEEIPEGWEVGKFGDHISSTRGLSYKGAGLCRGNEGLPMHNLNSIFEGGGYKNDGIKYYKGEYREKHLLKPGDLIVTNTEQGFDRLLIGYAAIVPERFGPVGLYSHHIYRIDTKSKSFLTSHYLVHLFNSSFYHHWISGFANGTTINMLPMDALEIPLLVVPPSELVRVFTILAQDIHAQFQSNWGQSRTLAALRDTLLPKLISDELRVRSQKQHD